MAASAIDPSAWLITSLQDETVDNLGRLQLFTGYSLPLAAIAVSLRLDLDDPPLSVGAG